MMQFEGSYRIGAGGSARISEKIGLSEIAEIEGFLVLENVEVVVLLVLESWNREKQSENREETE